MANGRGPGNRVAVIGLGAIGLVTVKNLKEEGFDVTGFEKNGYVGGLWHFTEDENKTSVLRSTVVNVSAPKSCYTDFPLPSDLPNFFLAKELDRYLESYTDHYNLRPSLRLSTTIDKVARNEEKGQWELYIHGTPHPELFDRVVIATGINQRPCIPKIPGFHNFKGKALHSRAFKNPEHFTGKRVLVVGLGNTGADIAMDLIGHAKEIYVSHRQGTFIIPRTNKGKALDHGLTVGKYRIMGFMERYFPSLAEKILNSFMQHIQDEAFALDPSWGLSPAPSMRFSIPVISDSLIPEGLAPGKVKSVGGVKEFLQDEGGKSVTLLPHGSGGDGTNHSSEEETTIHVDVVIWCTGYMTTAWDILSDASLDPTKNTTNEWEKAEASGDRPLPRLWKGIFSLQHPETLAFMGCMVFPTPVFQLYDIASMALAQLWNEDRPATFPSRQQMERDVDLQHAYLLGILNGSPGKGEVARRVHPGWVNGQEWMRWADRVAGLGIEEHLSWASWKAWWFWITNPKLYGLLTGGVWSPHIYRLFNTGRRRKWEGAKDELVKVNELVATRKMYA